MNTELDEETKKVLYILSHSRMQIIDLTNKVNELEEKTISLESINKTLLEQNEILHHSKQNIKIGFWLGDYKEQLLQILPEAFESLKSIILSEGHD